jgi:hypothetical protein
VSGEFGPRGLRLAKDSTCTPTIRQMRAMVLAGKPYASVAQWLNGQAIRPGPYAKIGRWSARLVADFLRAPLLHGERTFRNVMHQPILRTGKHRREPNPNPERQSHPELAHFTVEEHTELLRVLETRAASRRRRRGTDHPRYRLPRSKAIGPAQHLVCQICGGLMYCYDKGQLKCSNTFLRGDHQCWNRVQGHAEFVRRGALRCLREVLQLPSAARDSFLGASWRLIQRSTNTRADKLCEVDEEKRRLEQQADRLAQAIADGGEFSALVKRLKEVQAAIEAASARHAALERQASQENGAIDYEAFYRDPFSALLDFCRKSYEFAELLRQVISEINVVPVQDLLHGQVRPRIKMSVRFPEVGASQVASDILVHRAVFDAFEKPKHIRHVDRARHIKRQHPDYTYAQIAESIGISKESLKRTLAYMRLMDEQGVTDPYVELTSKPVRASRWRHREARDPTTKLLVP